MQNLLRSIAGLDRRKKIVVALSVLLIVITWAAFCLVLASILPG